MLPAEVRDAGQVCFASVVRLLILGRDHSGGELVEEVLKSGGRDDLEDAARGIAGVPEGVPLAARLEYQVTRPGVNDIRAELGAEAAFEHIAVLIFADVPVHRRGQVPRRDRVLDQREPAA